MSKIKVLAGLVFYNVYFLGLWMVVSLCLHTVFFVCVCVCVLISSYKDIHHVALGLTLMNSF